MKNILSEKEREGAASYYAADRERIGLKPYHLRTLHRYIAVTYVMHLKQGLFCFYCGFCKKLYNIHFSYTIQIELLIKKYLFIFDYTKQPQNIKKNQRNSDPYGSDYRFQEENLWSESTPLHFFPTAFHIHG